MGGLSYVSAMSSSSCPACSSPLDDSHRFCPGCGVSLDVDSPTGTAPRRGLPATPRPGPAVATAPLVRAARERFAPGSILLDRYRIVGLLGRGGMGEVYRADDLKLEQPVALKFLPRALEGDPERLERLYAEVRMARQVSHPQSAASGTWATPRASTFCRWSSSTARTWPRC